MTGRLCLVFLPILCVFILSACTQNPANGASQGSTPDAPVSDVASQNRSYQQQGLQRFRHDYAPLSWTSGSLNGSTASISFTTVPTYGEIGWVEGQVSGVTVNSHVVLLFVEVGGGWYNKPSAKAKLIPISSNGQWSASLSHKNDAYKFQIAAYLVPKSALPTPDTVLDLEGPKTLPSLLASIAVARVRHEAHETRRLWFSGYEWNVKFSGDLRRLGPGNNWWADATRNVWISGGDARVEQNSGTLHLSIKKHPTLDKWECVEVFSRNTFGYGTYIFTVKAGYDLSRFDPNAIVGLFTWDYTEAEGPPHHNREIDIELGRWGNRSYDTQYAVAPYTPANALVSNFSVDVSLLSAQEDRSTHVMTWTTSNITFQSFYGADHRVTSNAMSAPFVINDPSKIPVSGKEQVLLQLWLISGQDTPQSLTEVEVVIERFQFIPL